MLNINNFSSFIDIDTSTFIEPSEPLPLHRYVAMRNEDKTFEKKATHFPIYPYWKV